MRNLFSLLFLVLLASCGGGSGSGGTSGNPPAVPFGVISGTAFDGLIINGAVNIFDFSTGSKGASLGHTTTDTTGHFTVSLQAESRPILIQITGGYYLEEAGANFQVALTSNHKLTALTQYTTGTDMAVAVTALSHLAAGLAQFEISQGTPVDAAISGANTRVSSLVGVNIITTTPRVITDPANASANLTPELKYGFLTAAISQWTYSHAPNASSAHSTPYTSIDFAQLMYQDVLADGVLDGQGRDSTGSVGQLSYGVTLLGVDSYRLALGAALVQIAGGANNKTGLTGAAVLPFARTYIASTDAMFNNIIPPTFTLPTVSITAPSSNSTATGVLHVAGVSQAVIGLSSVAVQVDGTTTGTTVNLSAPAYSLDTTAFADGPHTVSLLSTDFGGQTATAAAQVTFNNIAPGVTVTGPASGDKLSGAVSVTAAITSIVGLSKVELFVDGVFVATAANLAAPSFSLVTTAYLDGAHTIGVRATTLGGLVTNSAVPVVFANVSPVVVLTSPAANIFASGMLSVTATTQSHVGLLSVELLVDGAAAGTSTNHTSPSFTLDTTGFGDGSKLISVRATDVNNLVTTTSVTVTFNNVAPVVSLTNPVGSSKVSGLLGVTGTAQSVIALSTVELMVDNASVFTSTTNLNLPSFQLNTAAYADGNHSIALRASSVGGKVSVSSVQVMFSNHVPTLTLNNPINGTWYKQTIAVNGIAGSGIGLSTVELLVDGAFVSLASNMAAPSFTVDTTAYSDGQHTVGMRATDVNGLVTTVSVSISIDNTWPTSTAAVPFAYTPQPTFGGWPMVCVTENGSGVQSVNDVNQGGVTGLFSVGVNQGNGCWKLFISGFSPSPYLDQIQVKDKVGHCSTYDGSGAGYGSTWRLLSQTNC